MSVSGQSAAGVTVPDTKLAREATELVRDSTSDLIYNHSRRVFWFGSLRGRGRGLSFDPELVYIGAMFHDLGLNEQFRGSGRRFEVESADEARRVLQGHGVPEAVGLAVDDLLEEVRTAVSREESYNPRSHRARLSLPSYIPFSAHRLPRPALVRKIVQERLGDARPHVGRSTSRK